MAYWLSVNIFINEFNLNIRMTLERIQSLDPGNPIGQMSESRPSRPKSTKLNVTRIREYQVLHLAEIESSFAVEKT